MSSALSTALPPLRFGPSLRFELQPAEGRLLVDGEAVALGQRALALLVALAERPDRLQTKHELIDRVWPGLVVEEANLQVQISNLRKVLGGDVIGTVPGRGYRFTAAVVPVGAPTPPGAAATASVVPAAAAEAPAAPLPAAAAGGFPAQRLIGRDHDLARLEGLLQSAGCVTLVGPTGVGKTSLARAVAARRPGRSVWVDLAALAPDSPVAAAVARALELQLTGRDDEAPAQLLAALRGQALLLVLDNAEHLLGRCAELVAALSPLPALQLLVTSQAPLAVVGEQLLRLEPLALPDEGAVHAPVPEGALALLIERIRAADHRFEVTPAALPLLRALCLQLDGLPLALEMAAARVPLLGLQGVHDALAQRFALLARGRRDAALRHRTLHDAIEWSYRLLDPADQQLLGALGVFAGGFTLELAVALMTDEAQSRWAVIDGLATLVDRSLVVASRDDPPRYRLLESVRAFALAQLAQADGAGAVTVRRRHAEAVAALFDRYQPGDLALQAQCVAEMENAREALAWSRGQALALAARLSGRVVAAVAFTVWRHEAGNWLLALEPVMDGAAGRALPAEVQAAWWTSRSYVGAIRREAHAPVAAQRAVALWRPLGQPHRLLGATMTWVRCIAEAGPVLDAACAELRELAASLTDLAPRQRLNVLGALLRADVMRGDHAAVLAGREQELVLTREVGDVNLIHTVESNRVCALVNVGRHAEAAEHGQALLARVDADGSGRDGNLPWVLSGLAAALLALDRAAEVRAMLPRLCAAGRRFDTPVMALPLCGLAAAERRYAAAVQLLGHARAAYAARDMAFEPEEETGLARILADAGAALGPGPVAALLAQGRTLDVEAAEALAAATA